MSDIRAEFASKFRKMMRADGSELASLAGECFAENTEVHVSSPVGELTGPEAIAQGLFRPLSEAFTWPDRRDLLVLGGDNRRDVGGEWVVILTHVTGVFSRPLWGIKPSGKLAYLRVGEFWRIENGVAVEGRIIIDLLDLLHQTGRWPLSSEHYGQAITFPAPATQDGLLPADRAQGSASLDVVEEMLANLHHYVPGSFGSDGQVGQGGTWAEDFAWYGPGGVGSTTGWDGFVSHHRSQFLTAFPDRKGGNHYCRIGDGNFAAISGWPSMTMTHQGEYLGIPGTQKALTLRVMDFYRCENGLLAENWVLLDYIDLLNQMGVDAIALAAVGD